MRELNQRPHTRVVYYDIADDVIGRISDLFPTGRVIGALDEVFFGDWDLLITGEPLPLPDQVDPDVFVIAFSEGWLGSAAGMHNGVLRLSHSHLGAISVAAQFVVPEDLPRPYAELVPELLAATQPDAPHSCLLAGSRLVKHVGGNVENVAISDVLRPILGMSDGYAIAAWWQRPGAGVTLSLPPYLIRCPNPLDPGGSSCLGAGRSRPLPVAG